MTEETKVDGTVYGAFPGPGVGAEAAAGTLHPELGTLQPNADGRPRIHTFVARDAGAAQAAIDAGLLAPATTAEFEAQQRKDQPEPPVAVPVVAPAPALSVTEPAPAPPALTTHEPRRRRGGEDKE